LLLLLVESLEFLLLLVEVTHLVLQNHGLLLLLIRSGQPREALFLVLKLTHLVKTVNDLRL